MKITREIKTAILVIASILLFIWGYSFLKGRDLFINYKTFYVEYKSVEGLATSAPVTLNGLVVGKVSSIAINENTGTLLVELQLKTDFPISKSSVASIYEPGFIGGKQIAIIPNFADKTLAVDGQRLKAGVKMGLTDKVGDQLAPLQEKLEKLLGSTEKLISGLNNVLDQQGQQELKLTLAELSKTMEQFHKASKNVNGLLDDNRSQITSVVTKFDKISGDFSQISASLNKADVGKTVTNLNATLAKVDGIVNGLESGKGSMGKLLNDEAFYQNIKTSTKELELLLQDVRLHPTRYVNISVFGKKDKPYVAPVQDSVSTIKN
ncbi:MULTISPECIES: MlaD family protein [Flavobacterium]|uniref:Phospholipid/cholesterol/gamma-HCH transport system substrate-binding protein n=1 Tax=Flavobacterium weaverense TaxID=271156 RepID=A0A3L9ZUV4_9FLAO|nr:MlaD family protein [Flavobacterium weaverense]RMA76084.1 phospholipid/cholesterol/gamma-HCH transport system substrate-binding protein [Flavobacterium weaverense]